MSATLLLDEFPLVARAPNGIGRIRELIHYFALSGGLSERRNGDSTAAEVVEDALQKKEEYLATSRTRRGSRKHAALIDVVRTHPSHWEVTDAGNLLDLINGRAFKSTEWNTRGKPIIRIQNLNDRNAPFNYFQGEAEERHQVQDGDMLLSWSGTPGTSFGAFIWDRGDAVLNQHIFKIAIFSELLDKRYLQLAINACLDVLIGSARGGVGLKHVTKGQIEAMRIPLPPLEEQKRIVAKVDELMGLCDRLESQFAERAKLLPLLSQANHARFVEEPTEENLKALFHASPVFAVENLHETILNLAVSGRLTNVDDRDGSVDELLDRIDNERSNAGHRSIRTQYAPASREPLGYAIPERWASVRLEDVLVAGPTNGVSPKAVEHETAIRSLTLTATTSGRFDGTQVKYIAADTPIKEDWWLLDGDILVQRGNTIEYVGVPAVYHGEDRQFIYPDLMMRIRPSRELNVDFIHLAMSAEPSRDFLRNRATGTAGTMPKINQKVLKSLPLPMPPRAEQDRLVRQCEHFFKLVDGLIASHKKLSELTELFSGAVVSRLTGTESEEDHTMKPPAIEIHTTLKKKKKPPKVENALLVTLLANESLSAKTLWLRSGLEIDAFYRQLKTEISNGWIAEPEPATVKEVEAD